MSDSEERYNYFYKKGKKYFKENKYDKSLDALKSAYAIKPSQEMQTKINKIEALANPDEPEQIIYKPDENKTLIDGKFYVNSESFSKLYNYQREGVLWLFRLFETRKGGILADDMGLGKTVQMIFFLRELFESDLINTALVVMPKSLLINWKREFSKWAPDLLVLLYIDNERERNLNKVNRRGGILLTTYGTILHNWDDLNYDSKFKWNVLVLDEGHKIKNPSSKTFKAINAIRADLRIVMTGTAVQNKLKELWALFDFTHQGTLLGNYPTFLIEYERPLTASRKKDATEVEKMYGEEMAKSLKSLIKAYFLRRTKEEVTKTSDSNGSISVPKLTRKNDLIVWIQMTAAQVDIYQKFLQLDDVKQLLTMSEKRSPLMELNILKKICDHPRLLPAEHCAEMGLMMARKIQDLDVTILQQESGKMEFLIRLLKNLTRENHKCLVFSQSKVVLNIVSRILSSNNIIHLRLDGDVLKPIDRQNIVDLFNTDMKFKVLLLTSQVGGVGLTLTGADRAIIYDLSWNPSVDAQAVDRLYRIGQLQNVVVYRLITCGTVEEKIYRRQIFKDSVNRQTTGIEKTDNNPFRYFTSGELLELFTLDDPTTSETQKQLEAMHSGHRRSDARLDGHLVWLNEQNIFGVSDHDLMFSKEEEIVTVDDETRERLTDNMRQAESRLLKEANYNANDGEGVLRLLMSKMSLGDKKNKPNRVKEEDMFIPNKSDTKKRGFMTTYLIPKTNEAMQGLTKTVVEDDINLVKEDEEYVVLDNSEGEEDTVTKSVLVEMEDLSNEASKDPRKSKGRKSKVYLVPNSEDDDEDGVDDSTKSDSNNMSVIIIDDDDVEDEESDESVNEERVSDSTTDYAPLNQSAEYKEDNSDVLISESDSSHEEEKIDTGSKRGHFISDSDEEENDDENLNERSGDDIDELDGDSMSEIIQDSKERISDSTAECAPLNQTAEYPEGNCDVLISAGDSCHEEQKIVTVSKRRNFISDSDEEENDDENLSERSGDDIDELDGDSMSEIIQDSKERISDSTAECAPLNQTAEYPEGNCDVLISAGDSCHEEQKIVTVSKRRNFISDSYEEENEDENLSERSGDDIDELDGDSKSEIIEDREETEMIINEGRIVSQGTCEDAMFDVENERHNEKNNASGDGDTLQREDYINTDDEVVPSSEPSESGDINLDDQSEEREGGESLGVQGNEGDTNVNVSEIEVIEDSFCDEDIINDSF